MARNPLNLAVRFLLELAALVAIGYWGFDQDEGVWRFVLGLGSPLLAAAAWATFRVPGDHSASGDAPVPIPGALRLLLEWALFGLAAWALYAAGHQVPALILASITIIHYALSYDRIGWLLQHRSGESA